jgi:hypothetical protein
MALMSDLFKRGIQFDGVTGLKTGANLEDLVTRCVPVVGSQLVDQSSIETYADSGIVDDASVAINRLRVKAGGITAAMLAANAGMGTLQTLTGTDIVVSAGITAPTWDNMFDGDSSTFTAEFTIPSLGSYIYTDLTAPHDGFLRILGQVKLGTGSQIDVSSSCFYDVVGTTGGGSVEVLSSANAGFVYFAYVARFFGRYPAVSFFSFGGGTSVCKMARFDVYLPTH